MLKLPPNVCRPERFLFPTRSIQFWLWTNLGTLCRAKRIIVRTVIILGRGCLPLGLTWPGGARDRGTAGRTGVHLWWNLQYSHPDTSHSVPLLCSAGSAVGQKNEDISQTATVTPWLTSNKRPIRPARIHGVGQHKVSMLVLIGARSVDEGGCMHPVCALAGKRHLGVYVQRGLTHQLSVLVQKGN